uniref:7TM GPCR serpentine receptor class x (Srx) domain-containing protein n=1 Tax=Globodera rostochiensis TaxID=31243 RepID=A0A914I6I4_GLORO
MNRRQFGVVLSEMGAVQKRIFAQVFLVSLINTFASFLYVYLQSNEVNQWMITFTEFAWFHVHGLPPVIYLAFNKTIRADCRLMFVKLFQSHRIDHIGVVTVVRPKITLMNGTSRNYNAGASSAQAVAKWLITPRGDGMEELKRVICQCLLESANFIIKFWPENDRFTTGCWCVVQLCEKRTNGPSRRRRRLSGNGLGYGIGSPVASTIGTSAPGKGMAIRMFTGKRRVK